MFIYEVCAALDRANVPYAIVGGYAVALHGAVRGTIDIDIVIHWTLKNLEKVEKVFKDLGLTSLLPIHAKNLFDDKEEYIENRNLIAWNFYDIKNPLNQVDLIINYDLKLKKTKTVGKIKILALDELIIMKKDSGRPQDLEDVKALQNILP